MVFAHCIQKNFESDFLTFLDELDSYQKDNGSIILCFLPDQKKNYKDLNLEKIKLVERMVNSQPAVDKVNKENFLNITFILGYRLGLFFKLLYPDF